MEDIAGKIALYHNLFLGCLLAAIGCLILAVVLFFVLDIRSVLGYLTGRRARRQIQKLEEINASSGRLQTKERSNMQYVAQELKEDMGVRGTATPGIRKVEDAVQNEPASNYASQQNVITDQTEDFIPEEMTALLSAEQETALLQHAEETDHMAADTAALQRSSVKTGSFKIEREIILIHAEEVI